MPTFVDESGDTGSSPDSAHYFRLGAVWLPKSVEAGYREAIRELRRRLKLSDGFEFKFARSHSVHERRVALFDVSMRFPFRFAFCSIDKRKGNWALASKEELHWTASVCLAVGMRPIYREAELGSFPLKERIFVDDNGDAAFLRKIEEAFRGVKSKLAPMDPMVLRPRFRDSHKDEALQLADMLCGAAGARVDNDSMWYDLVAERCCDFTTFP